MTLEKLNHFVEAEDVSCRSCKYFNKANWDCRNPKTARTVTNKFDFGTHIIYPIASALRAYTGACSPSGKNFEAKS